MHLSLLFSWPKLLVASARFATHRVKHSLLLQSRGNQMIQPKIGFGPLGGIGHFCSWWSSAYLRTPGQNQLYLLASYMGWVVHPACDAKLDFFNL